MNHWLKLRWLKIRGLHRDDRACSLRNLRAKEYFLGFFKQSDIAGKTLKMRWVIVKILLLEVVIAFEMFFGFG